MLRKRIVKKHLISAAVFACLSLSVFGCGIADAPATSEEREADTETSTLAETEDTDTEQEPASGEDEPEETEIEEESEPQPEENPEIIYNIDDSAALKDWTITVTDVQIVESITDDYMVFSPSAEDSKFMQVFITVTNDGKEADNFLPSYYMGDDVTAKILYSDGYEFSATYLMGYDNELHDSTINPLSSQSGEICFEIPNTVADSEDELFIQFSSGNDMLKFKLR